MRRIARMRNRIADHHTKAVSARRAVRREYDAAVRVYRCTAVAGRARRRAVAELPGAVVDMEHRIQAQGLGTRIA